MNGNSCIYGGVGLRPRGLRQWFENPNEIREGKSCWSGGGTPPPNRTWSFELRGASPPEPQPPRRFGHRAVSITPLTPCWLENTGARAFQEHFKSRDWNKEFEKLQEDLRRTPSFFTNSGRTFGGEAPDDLRGPAGFPPPAEPPLIRTSDGEGRWRSPAGAKPGGGGARRGGEPRPPPQSSKTPAGGLPPPPPLLEYAPGGQPAFTPAPPGAEPDSRGSSNRQGRIDEARPIYENLLKRRKKRVRTLKLLNILRTAGGNKAFQGFIFTTLPVLPPELRPIVQLSAGQFASSDVNDLYRRLISRNNRLKYYFTACGPHLVEFLVRSEQHLVQVAVDSLLDGSSAAAEINSLRRSGGASPFTPTAGGGARPSGSKPSGAAPIYKSLSDRIGGKQGRFRQNLLGKRVDYSGRSVIVVGPRLKLHECGLPYEMAIELFQAFVIRHILELQLAKTIRGAKNLLKLNKPFARQVLRNIVEAHPVLLNRAPTLHRLGIQAFQPKLISGRAIQLHPLVCTAFNADFDGDQMAVHLPLSPKSRIEARLLMLATTNWLSAATGQPSILPSQDMVLGFYYLTTMGGLRKPPGPTSGSRSEVPVVSRVSSLLTMTGILQQGPSQRNSVEIHKPVWLQKEFLWGGEGCFGRTITGERSPPGAFGRGPFIQPSYSLPVRGGRGSKAPIKLMSPPADRISQESEDAERRRLSSVKERSCPLHIRVFSSGLANQVYHSYKWTQDPQQNRSNKAIRTTPGRVLINEILKKLGNQN